MKLVRWLLVIAFGVLLALSACAPIPLTGGTAPTEAVLPDDYLSLLDDLRSTGVEVVSSGEIEQSLFDVVAQAVTVDGDNVQIFIFENEHALQAAQRAISDNAAHEDPSWGSRPYFWSTGRMLALYSGENPNVLISMNMVLGEPIIKPPEPIVPPGLGRKESG